MINIFFVPGMFGSTIEYVLRSFTKEFTPVNTNILSDGSMHAFSKEFHPTRMHHVDSNTKFGEINTPIYPVLDGHLDDMLTHWPITADDKFVIMCAADQLSAELTMLFQYYKIASGSVNLGLDIFFQSHSHNVKNWNSSYESWKDLQHWELRELLSLMYPIWVTEWINPVTARPHLTVVNTDMLSAPTLLGKR